MNNKPPVLHNMRYGNVFFADTKTDSRKKLLSEYNITLHYLTTPIPHIVKSVPALSIARDTFRVPEVS